LSDVADDLGMSEDALATELERIVEKTAASEDQIGRGPRL
jgi:hypothetical protein